MCTRISLFFAAVAGNVYLQDSGRHVKCPLFLPDFNNNYEGWNFNSGNYLFTTDTK